MVQVRTRDALAFQALVAVILLIVLIAIILPLWRVIVTAFPPLDVYTRGGAPLFLAPGQWTAEAFRRLLGHPLFPRAMLNSVIITLAGTALSLVLTVPLAYGLSSHALPGRNGIMLMILFTFLFNPGLIPVYLLVTKLGLTNSFWAIILPPAVGVTNTLGMMRFFEGLPE